MAGSRAFLLHKPFPVRTPGDRDRMLPPALYYAMPYTYGGAAVAGYQVLDETGRVMGRLTETEARMAERARVLEWEDHPLAATPGPAPAAPASAPRGRPFGRR